MEIKIIFKQSYPKFRAYAYTFTEDYSSAEDLVMEVFKKLIERKEVLPSDINPEAYIIRSIRNQFIDTRRKDKMLTPIETATEAQLADVGSINKVSEGSSLSILVKNLESIGENCKNVLALFGLGHSYNEIAEIEDISAGTVMSRMARCREKLLVAYQE